MSVKNVGLFALALGLLGVGTLAAQGPATPSYAPSPSYTPPPDEILAGPPPVPGQVLAAPGPAHSLSSWILYNQPGCCGPLGNHQPLRYELYLRAGPSIPLEGEVFGRALETGWAIQGGARILFFNQPQTFAWTADLSVSNIHNNARRDDVQVEIERFVANPNFNQFLPPGPNNPRDLQVDDPVSIRALNRTFVNLSGGWECYLLGDGSCRGPSWRCGMDLGGRWGSAKAEFIEIRHRTDVVGSLFVALHSDLELPIGCCIFTAGFRAEWDYSWSDILQEQNNADMQDLILLGTIGVRF